MRFSDVAAGAFGQPYQHNQLDARLLAFAQHFHHRPPPHGPRSSPHGLESSIAVTLLAHAHPHDTQRLEKRAEAPLLSHPPMTLRARGGQVSGIRTARAPASPLNVCARAALVLPLAIC